MFRAISIFFTAAIITVFVGSAYAMQVNLNLADDIKSNQDPLNINYHIYYASGPGPFDKSEQSQNFKGLVYSQISNFVRAFNQSIADKHPVDSIDGKHSEITLGFKKNSSDVYPTTCQNIRLQDVNNITLSETGCVVS